MSQAPVLDLASLRRGCAFCSLQQLCLPAGINAQELQRLDEIVRRSRPVERGERLYRLGDPLTAVYVARDGAFKTISISEEGEEQVLGFHLPGELIGLDALGAGAHRCEAVALATSNVCEVPFNQLASVAAQLPSLQQQLLKVIGKSVDRDQDHLGMLVRRQAGERIALFLHGLSERYRNIGHSPAQFKLNGSYVSNFAPDISAIASSDALNDAWKRADPKKTTVSRIRSRRKRASGSEYSERIRTTRPSGLLRKRGFS